MQTTSLEEEGGGGGNGLWDESLAARVSNPSGGGGGFWEESDSLATRVSAEFSNHSGGGDDNGDGGSSSKKTKTRFTQDQKDKMMEFAHRLGWKMKKQNEDIVQQFCDEIGVKRHALKVWMYNTKHTLTRVSSDGSSSKKRFKSKFTAEQTDKMLEFGKRLGWRILKQDEDAVRQFCEETAGVNPQVLKAWVYNKRYTHGYSPQEGRTDSQSKIKKVETRKRHLEAETQRCTEESKFGQTLNCHDLSVKLENKKIECIAVQDKYRDGLKEWISCLEDQKVISERGKREQERITNLHFTHLEEDKKVICEREKRAQERITYSEEELRKTGRNDMERYVLIKTDNRDLEFSKRRAEDEIEVCEKRFMLFADPSLEDGRRKFNFQM